MLGGAVVRDVKKFAAGRELWNDRIGADLNVVFEAPTRAEVSRKGCRIANAILCVGLRKMFRLT